MTSSDVAVYRRLVPLLRPYRLPLVGALVLAACGPLLTAARIWLLKLLIDAVLPGTQAHLLLPVAAAFVGIALARGVLTFGQERLTGAVGTAVVRDLRAHLYADLQGMSLRYFHVRRLGDLLTRLSGDIAAIEDLLVTGLAALVTHLATLVLFVSLLIYLDPGLLAVAAGMVPVLAALTVVEARRGRRAQRALRESTSELTSTAEEGLSAVALVKAFARGPFEVARFAKVADDSAVARLQMVRLRAVFPPLSDLVTACGTAVVVVLGARQVLAGQLSVGSLVVFISYLVSLYVPVQGLGRLGSSVQRALVGGERVVEVLETPSTMRDRVGADPLPPLQGRVALQQVTFGYAPERPVLHDVTFEIAPGEMVALIGASGAGKTTVVSLILGFNDPDSGAVTVDGHAVRDHDPADLRRQVAAVLQEPMLFNTSVSENIRYGRLDATAQDIRAAAVAADAAEFVEELPDGFETVVGVRGSILSGGQRQRLALARALVKAAPIVILDEPTSALDPATEARVLAGVRTSLARSAVLLVAHRWSTVQHADRVVVLERGRVVQQGDPRELMTLTGPYREFALAQGAALTHQA